MSAEDRHSKITSSHLERRAYIYVRQSSEHQVRHHLESQQRQYELSGVARGLGWREDAIVTIDDDLGKSASGRAERVGFERLVSEVALGQAGIVFGLEVSRLARNNRDWYQLLDLCAARQTLIADADGIYDPSDYNDRLLLGLKGTMSEAELHILKSRMLAGMRHKAAKGELRFHLPPGYEFDEVGSTVKTSNEEVEHLITLVFAKFFEMGTISAVTKYLLHEGLRFPRKASWDATIRWVTPYYRAVYSMLTNPIYAGAYAYGRSEVITVVDVTGNRTSRQRPKPMEDWDVLIQDHHPAYISWDQYMSIRKMGERNRAAHRDQASTAIREGAALLQGLARCGRCGRSMTVRYSGHQRSSGKTFPYYCCNAANAQKRAGHCQSVGGRRIDQEVTRIFLEEVSAASVDIHLAGLRKLDEHDDNVLNQLELQLESARYEAERFERQYERVEPENRIVARTLETRWNDALEQIREIENKVAERKLENAVPLTSEEERLLQELAHDLPQLWSHDGVTDKDRKALLRTVVDEVQLLKEDRTVAIKLIWKGGADTRTTVQLPRVPTPPPTPTDLIDLIRELAPRFSDAQIARILIRRRIKTPKKKLTFTSRHVAGLRRNYDIPCGPTIGDELAQTYTVEQAAKLFEVSAPTVYSWLQLGVLRGEQITASAPWQIHVSDADKARLIADAPAGWLTPHKAAVELGVSKQTILNWVKAQKIPYVYVTHGRRRGLRIDVNSAPQRTQQRLIC